MFASRERTPGKPSSPDHICHVPLAQVAVPTGAATHLDAIILNDLPLMMLPMKFAAPELAPLTPQLAGWLDCLFRQRFK